MSVISNPTTRITEAAMPNATVEIIPGDALTGTPDKVKITPNAGYTGTETLQFSTITAAGAVSTDSVSVTFVDLPVVLPEEDSTTPFVAGCEFRLKIGGDSVA